MSSFRTRFEEHVARWRPRMRQRASPNADVRVKEIFQELCASEDKRWMKQVFPSVRILVIGRSGSGKSTLIRLVVGNAGPEGIRAGTAGNEDINREFHYYGNRDSFFKLIIHDSNGVDIQGHKRVEEIRNFLEDRQRSTDILERVHLIWYVISSVDTRCLDNADIMKVASEAGGVPVLLIMSFDDYVRHKAPEDRIVTDEIVDQLLEGAENKESIKRRMVRVGNDGVKIVHTEGGQSELVMNKSKIDRKALSLVAERTQELLNENVRSAWAGLQAVSLQPKLDASARCIVRSEWWALGTSWVPFLPEHELRIALLCVRLFDSLCVIWNIPETFEKAMKETLVHRKGSSANAVLTQVATSGLVEGIISSALTGDVTIPTGAAFVAASNQLFNATSAMAAVKAFGLQILFSIFYVRFLQPRAMLKLEWQAGLTQDQYKRHCLAVMRNDHYKAILLEVAQTRQSRAPFRNERRLILRKIIDLVRDLHLRRKDSLFSRMEQDKEDATASSSSTFPTFFDAQPDLLDELDDDAQPELLDELDDIEENDEEGMVPDMEMEEDTNIDMEMEEGTSLEMEMEEGTGLEMEMENEE